MKTSFTSQVQYLFSISSSSSIAGLILKKDTKVADCVFGKLSTQGEHELDNYLDTIWTIDPVHIKQRIKELHKNCPAEKSKEFRIGSWKPFSHNCEHIANYVRYGNEVSLQV